MAKFDKLRLISHFVTVHVVQVHSTQNKPQISSQSCRIQTGDLDIHLAAFLLFIVGAYFMIYLFVTTSNKEFNINILTPFLSSSH